MAVYAPLSTVEHTFLCSLDCFKLYYLLWGGGGWVVDTGVHEFVTGFQAGRHTGVFPSYLSALTSGVHYIPKGFWVINTTEFFKNISARPTSLSPPPTHGFALASASLLSTGPRAARVRNRAVHHPCHLSGPLSALLDQ